MSDSDNTNSQITDKEILDWLESKTDGSKVLVGVGVKGNALMVQNVGWEVGYCYGYYDTGREAVSAMIRKERE